MFHNVFFGLLLTITSYELAKLISKKSKNAFLNPLLLAIFLIVFFLFSFKIPYSEYMIGASYLSTLLIPATAALGIRIYEQRYILKSYWMVIVVGSIMGTLTSIISTFLLVKVFHVDEIIYQSLLAKNVTTAIAIGITERLSGIVPITIFAVIIAGLVGYLGGEYLCSLFGIKHDVAKGVAIGTASHALGTTKAITMSQVSGAMSSMSLALSGLFTLLLLLWIG